MQACRLILSYEGSFPQKVDHLYITTSKKFSPKNKKDLGMACHTPPLTKVKKQGEMPLPSCGPIPLKKWDGMGPRLGSPCFLTFLRGGV